MPGRPTPIGGGLLSYDTVLKRTFPTPYGKSFNLWSQAWTCPPYPLRWFAMRNDIQVNQSPVYVVEGMSFAPTITFEQAAAVSLTSAKIYKDGTDVTGTNMSGATAVSGNTVTLPTIASLVGGERYVVALTATVDGAVQIRRCVLVVAAVADE